MPGDDTTDDEGCLDTMIEFAYDSDDDFSCLLCYNGVANAACCCCKVDEEACGFDCGCGEFNLVECTDERCCNICLKCYNIGSSIASCFQGIFSCFSGIASLIYYLFGCRKKREWLYGPDVNPNNNGRLPVVHRWISHQQEHYMMAIATMVLSLADTGSDVYVIYKWCTFDPHGWEALTLGLICFVSWTTSFLLRCNWIPEDLGATMQGRAYDSDSEAGAGCCEEGTFLYNFFFTSRWCHLVGLGVVAEGFKALWDFDPDKSGLRNVNPYKWIEVLLESGPSALLTVYVMSIDNISKDGGGSQEKFAELMSAIISLLMISYGMANVFTKEIPMEKGFKDMGSNSTTRLIIAFILVACDLVFRVFLLTMWVNYGNILGIYQTWMKFIVGMCAVWVFEMIMVWMNGMIIVWWQIPITAYTQIFQGSMAFWSRSWPKEDKANRGHLKNEILFGLRYLANWGVFVWIYFFLSKADGSYIDPLWTNILIGVAAAEPVFFWLKPPAITAREAFPFIRIIMDMGYKAGREEHIIRRTTTNMTNGSVQMTSVPAGGRGPPAKRVNYPTQSMQNPDDSSSDESSTPV